MNIDSFVVNLVEFDEVPKNSVGVVKAVNGEAAMVYFVGANLTLRVGFENLREINLDETGKGYVVKICNVCHILKETSEFSVNQTDAKGRKTTRPSCDECRKRIDGKKLSQEENERLENCKPPKYSIFVCPICQKRSIVGITANLVKDHDHKTGEAREWICDSCNTGLGRFKDDAKFLQRVIEYLKRHDKYFDVLN